MRLKYSLLCVEDDIVSSLCLVLEVKGDDGGVVGSFWLCFDKADIVRSLSGIGDTPQHSIYSFLENISTLLSQKGGRNHSCLALRA